MGPLGPGYDDEPPKNGEVLDLHRREYIRQCLIELHRTIDDGAPVRGYFLWSFMDNFEWLDRYSRRFGICYTDYKNPEAHPQTQRPLVFRSHAPQPSGLIRRACR